MDELTEAVEAVRAVVEGRAWAEQIGHDRLTVLLSFVDEALADRYTITDKGRAMLKGNE